jgi:hypothetical protein
MLFIKGRYPSLKLRSKIFKVVFPAALCHTPKNFIEELLGVGGVLKT